MKKLLLSVVVIIILAMVAVFVFHLHPFGGSVKTYNDPSGAFSFAYPARYVITQNSGVPYLAVGTDPAQKPAAYVSATSYPDTAAYMAMLRAGGHDFGDPRTVGKYQVYTQRSLGENASINLVTIDGLSNATRAFIVGSYDWGNAGLSSAETDALIQSITFDQAKLDAYLQTQVDQARARGKEAKILEELSQMRTSAEVYYTPTNGYSSVCNPTEAEKDIRNTITSIKADAGATNFVCFNTKLQYAVSAKLPLGKIFCVDSTGYMGNTDKMATGTSCK